MTLLIQKPVAATTTTTATATATATTRDRDSLINNRTEVMDKMKRTNKTLIDESEPILQVWPTSSERNPSSDDEKEQPSALSESEIAQTKAENAFTSRTASDRIMRENRHRRHLSYDDHQIWSKAEGEKSKTIKALKRKRPDQEENKNNSKNEKELASLPISRLWSQNHDGDRSEQAEEESFSTDSITSSHSSANLYNIPVFSATISKGKSPKNDSLSSTANSATTFGDCKSPSPVEIEAEKGKDSIVPLEKLSSNLNQGQSLLHNEEIGNDDEKSQSKKLQSFEERQKEKKDNVQDSFPQMLVRAAQRSNTTTFNTAPQRKSCDRCFRMKTKCSRAQPGASTSGPCDGCIRRGFPHDCITSRPDYPHPRITLAKRPRLITDTSASHTGVMQSTLQNHNHENESRAYYTNPNTDQGYKQETYCYPSQPLPCAQKNLQPMQRVTMHREAWLKEQRNLPLPPPSNNSSCRENSSIYRQRLYHNFGEVDCDQTRISSLPHENTAAIAFSLAKRQGNLSEISSEELYEISSMATAELLRRTQAKK